MRRLGTLGVIAIPYLVVLFVGLIVARIPNSATWYFFDPTIRFWTAAAILAGSQVVGFNLFERLLSKLAPAPREWWRTLNSVWIAVLGALGVLNLVVAFTADEVAYVNVKLFGLTGIFWVAGIVLVYMHFSRRVPNVMTSTL